MTSKSMSSIAEKFSTMPCYRLGSTRFSRSNSTSGYNSIAAGLALWYGIVLDYNSMFCFSADKAQYNHGRILKHAIGGWPDNEQVLQDLLTSLDELGSLLLKEISSSTGFKVPLLLMKLKTWSVSSWLAPLKGCLLEIFRAGFNQCGDGDEVRVVSCIRQISCFLKKLDVDRSDLEGQMVSDFLSFEAQMSIDIPLRSQSEDYKAVVSEMKQLLAVHTSEFSMDPFVPGHGPGAVASTSVKCWYEKHTQASSDQRIGYLLGHAGLGAQSDYLPLVTELVSTRTSRYICVPKTWKQLRGISAEPSELQFWQQGVLGRIDAMFQHDEWWNKRIDLHSQQRSRDLALKGSITGSVATIDLSNASDSVTLQLVRDLFGNSHLGRWLLGTRSTFTSFSEGTTIRINKFAPMGSACCFPTECMIFCLAAEVAVFRTRKPFYNVEQVCVFGDDIIVPTFAATELIKILNTLGFSVNTEKSFWAGEFREACGIEAWRGFDIAPCRFRSWKTYQDRNSDYMDIASMVAFANELLDRGLHDTREFLLLSLFKQEIKIGTKSIRVQSTVFSSFSGECQTLASPQPTNFNLERKFSRALQTHVYKRVTWRERSKDQKLDSVTAESFDMCEYVTWLIRHQPGVQDFDLLWSNGWLECVASNPYARLPLGVTMVPTLKWAQPSYSISL